MSMPPAFSHWRPHPWHGLEIGPKPPALVHAYIEITPFDMVKYEIDKKTGYMRVDRPQKTSSHPPALYGFIPRTYCGPRVATLCSNCEKGDEDPLDICVISERMINRSEVILNARVIGGLQMVDDDEADDKIIAILDNDTIWENVNNIDELPENITERLRHYFSTYKLKIGKESNISIDLTYDRHHAQRVIQAAMQDYEDKFNNK